jgi:hypothetical protein
MRKCSGTNFEMFRCHESVENAVEADFIASELGRMPPERSEVCGGVTTWFSS